MDSNSSDTAPRSAGTITDALAKWEAEARSDPADLEEIRLDLNERLVIPFTTSVAQAVTHYVDYPSQRGYIRCIGTDCVLCRIGRQTDTRDLLPVYDVLARAVGVLPVSPSLRPQALRPQLTGVLRQLQANERVLLAIRKLDRTRYRVAPLPLPDDADDGAEVIADFLRRFAAGDIDLTSVYPRMTNEELAAIPEVATVLSLRGLKP